VKLINVLKDSSQSVLIFDSETLYNFFNKFDAHGCFNVVSKA